MTDKIKYPLVKIYWVDSRQPTASWQRLSEYEKPEPVLCEDVGWLIHDGKNAKAICASMGDLNDNDPQICGVSEIATVCIIKIEHLQVKILDERE